MKQIDNVNKSSVKVAKWSRNGHEMISVYPLQWSRITSVKPLLTMLALLMVCLFGVNENAWGWAVSGEAVKDGNGDFITENGNYYVLYESADSHFTSPSSKEYEIKGPGAQLSYEAKRERVLGFSGGKLKVAQKINNSYGDPLHDEEPPRGTYKGYGPYNVNRNATKIKFYTEIGARGNHYFQKIYITMAQYVEAPSTTSLNCGTADYLANSTNNSFTIAWCNVPAMTYELTGADADLFSVSISNNAEAGKWNIATITVTCNHSNRSGGHSATLTMKDSYGNYSKTITLSATTNKGTPSIDCSQVSASGLTYGQKLSTSTISGPNATYKNNSYAGTYTWTRSDASSHTALGCTNYSVTFTPTNTNLNSVTCTSVQVPMTKVAQTLTWNQEATYFIDQNATLSASTTGDADVYFTSSDETIATISGNTVVMHKAGDVVITAHADATCNYTAASTISHTLQFRNRPTLQWIKTGENDHIYAGDTLVHLAYASYGNNTFNLPFVYSVSPAGVLIPTINNDSLIANPELTQEAGCTVTATFGGNETYCAINGSQPYSVEPKITPLFKLGEEDLPESPEKRLDLKIGETANMTFVGTDESNKQFTYPTGTQYVSYTHNSEAHTGVITGTVAGEEVIQFHQTGTNTIFDHTRSIHVYVSKHDVTLSSPLADQTYHVDDSIDFADSYNISPAAGTHPQETVFFESSNEDVVKLVDGKIRAVGAGEADLTFRMADNAYWTGDTIVAHVTVIKYDPVITWNLEASYPWGAVINTPVTSTSDVPFTISSSDEAYAKVVDGKIEVYNKTTDNVTFTLNQPANYKYNAATTNVTKQISIYQPQNHVPFTINNDNNGDFLISNSSNVKWSTNGYKLGDGGLDKTACEFIISFTGIPSTLTFDKHLDNYLGQLPVGAVATVYESSDNENWTEIWSDETRTSDVESGELDLQPNTRYLKFYYNGSIYCHYNNIHVSDKTGFDAPLTYSFRTGYMGNLPTKRTIDVDWFNIQNCQVTLSGADKDQFELITTAFNANLDQYGTAGIRVNYKHDVEGTHTATLHIESADIPAQTVDITLTGTTEKAVQTMIWREDITPISVGESYEEAVYATSKLDITSLTSEDPSIVSVDGTTITGVSEGTTRLFVYQEGDSKWTAINETISVQVTALKVQHIIWKDRLGNLKRENNQTVTKTLNAYSDSGEPITYELDSDASQFASVSGNTLTITGWGTGKITAHQAGTNGYVAVSKTMNMASRNPNEGCNPLVLSNKSGSLFTIASNEYDIVGEPEFLTFDAYCDLLAINGLYIDEFYGGKYHRVQYIKRTGDNAITNNERSFGPFTLHRDATKLKFYTKVGATLTRYYSSVNVTLAKYLELVDNDMDFSAVDYGQVVYQEFYVDFSNISGVLDVELANESDQFEIVTETLGDECGDINHYARVQVRCTGRTLGTEENTIVISNKDQRLEVPVSATVVPASQVITWNDANPANVLTTDDVVMSATATSGEVVTFVSSDEEIAETYDKGDGTWGLTIHKYGDITITAKQGGNDNYGAAEDVEHTYIISRVEPTITTPPTATDLELPNVALSNSTLSGGEASVEGTFAWEDKTITAALGTNAYTVVFTPSNQDIYAPTTCEVNVKVLRAPQTITWDFDQLEMYCNAKIKFDATASPSGLKVSYLTSDNTIAYVDTNDSLRIIKGGEVTITAIQEGDETYAAATPKAKTLTIKREKPTVVTHPTATPMKIGKLLSNASLTDGRAELNGDQVMGSFAWKNGNEQVENVAGDFLRTVIFSPSNSNYYDTVQFMMTVTVEKYAPEITHTLRGSNITYGQALSQSNLVGTLTATDIVKVPNETVEGSYAWVSPDAKLSAGTQHATVRFTPDNTDWYLMVDFPVELTVDRASAASLTVTGVSEIFYGQILGEAVPQNTTADLLSGIVAGTMTWDGSLNLDDYPTIGDHDLPVTFTVTDPNYEPAVLSGTAVLTVQAGFAFKGTNGTAWNDAANWEGQEGIPGASDPVLIMSDVVISGNVSVDAMTIRQDVTVTVQDGAVLTVTNGDAVQRNLYGNMVVEQGGQVHMGAGTMHVNDFTLKAKLGDATYVGKSGQVLNPNSLQVNGNAYFDLALDPTHECTYGWYDFTVPFPVNAATGITRYSKSTGEEVVIKSEVHYAIMDFSESRRVETGYGWKKFYGIMQPGQCYSITTNNEDYIYRFKKTAGSLFNTTLSETLAYTETDNEVRGWNGLGNGTMAYADLSAAGIEKVQLYNHSTNSYIGVNIQDYTYVVGSAFFIQTPEADVNVIYTQNGASHTLRAPQRNREISEFTLTLSQDDTEAMNDRLFVGASDDALDSYEIGRDLTKFGTPTEAQAAQIWINAYGLKLCDMDMPLTGSSAKCELSVYAPKAGQYTLAIDEAPADATLYLTYNGRIIWNLSTSPYMFDLTKGTTEGYGLKLYVSQVATDIDQTDDAQDTGVRKVMIDNVIYIITPEGTMYDLMGKRVIY